MKSLKVLKRDGKMEKWSYDKILASIMKSMAPLSEAKIIASEVENWVDKAKDNDVINSNKIRDKVIELLEKVDPVSAKTYETFKK